jgi:hemerythrin-like domain-containing protein
MTQPRFGGTDEQWEEELKHPERHNHFVSADAFEIFDSEYAGWPAPTERNVDISLTKNSELFQSIREEMRSFPNCRKETCTCIKANSVDEKMRKIHGMCGDCVIDMEHEMRKAGTYEEYEKNKIRENALAWLRNAERDVELLKQAYTQASEFVTNADGETESWGAKMTPDEFEETVQKQFERFKENFLNKLNGVEETNENN